MTIEELVDTFLAIETAEGDILSCITYDIGCCYEVAHSCKDGCDVCWRNFLVEKLKEKLGNDKPYGRSCTNVRCGARRGIQGY